MRALIQRVSQATVTVDNRVVGAIECGFVVLVGVGQTDTTADAIMLAEKIAQLRIFSDAEGRFNYGLADIGGSVLVVSQFTLYADTRRGRRPSFSGAARPEQAVPLIDAFCLSLRAAGLVVATGVFGAHMDVALVNDGPVTIWLDSETLREPRRT